MTSDFREDIQGLRAVAVILVILSHLPAPLTLAGGFVGVDIFFVISGFVITRVLIRARVAEAPARGFFLSFIRRRVARLVPVLLVVVFSAIAASVLFAPTTELRQIAAAGFTAETFTSNFYYTLNFDTYWNPAVLRSPFLHTWSLGVEFQTYLVLPLLLLSSIGRPSSERGAAKRSVAVVLACMAASFALFVYLLELRTAPLGALAPRGLAFYTPFTRFWEFGLGVLPAMLAPASAHGRRPRRSVTFLAGALIAGGVAYSTVAKGLNLSVGACCVGIAMLIVQGERFPDATRSFLAWRPLVWIGDRSYSIYLWHWPLLVLCIWIAPGRVVPVFVAVAATLVCSALTYPLIEQRFRRTRGTQRHARLAWGTVLVGGTGALALAWGISGAGWYSARRPLSDVAVPFPASIVSAEDVLHALDGCAQIQYYFHCKNFSADRAEVVVIGDSLAYRSFPAVALAARRHGLNASMLWGHCSIEVDSCPKWIYDYLGHVKVSALIVTTNYDRAADRLNGTEIAYGARLSCPPNMRTQDCPLHLANIKKFRVDARAGLTQLESYTDRILVALPFPQQAKLVPECLNLPLFFRVVTPAYDGDACGKTSLAWQRARQGLYPTTIREVAAGDTKLTVWDPTDQLCHDGWCPAVINGGEKIMDDGIHWTRAASRYLYPVFSAFLDRPARP